MKHVINKNIVELFDGIEDLPAGRFNQFNKFIAIETQVGADLHSVQEHIELIQRALSVQNLELAHIELSNLRQCVYLTINTISPTMLAFASIVKTLNGKVFEPQNDDDYKELVSILNTQKHTWIVEVLGNLKKKFVLT